MALFSQMALKYFKEQQINTKWLLETKHVCYSPTAMPGSELAV